MGINAGGLVWSNSVAVEAVTYSDGLAAMRTLRSHLQSRLDADYAATFASYNGADVVLEDDEPQESDRVGKPFALLALASDDVSEESDITGRHRDVAVDVDVVASDWSGAQTGTANPVGSDTLLSRSLCEIIRADYAVLRDLGLMACTFRTTTGERIEESEAGEIHRNPHRITFTYETD